MREQTDAGLKRGHAAVSGVVDLSFRKNEDGIAAVGGFAGEAEALAETGKFRKRKNIEKRGDEDVAELVGPTFCEKPSSRRSSHTAKRFASHSGGEAMTESRGECGEDEPDIGATSDVIRNNDDGSAEILQMVAAENARVSQQLRGGPDERVIKEEAREAYGFAESPVRVVMVRRGTFSGGLRDKFFEVGDRLCLGEGGFVELDVVAVFEGREKFYAVQGR